MNEPAFMIEVTVADAAEEYDRIAAAEGEGVPGPAGVKARKHARMIERAKAILGAQPAPVQVQEEEEEELEEEDDEAPPPIKFSRKVRIGKIEGLDRPARQRVWLKAAKKGSREAATLLLKDTDGFIWQQIRHWVRGGDEEMFADVHAEVQIALLMRAIPNYTEKEGGAGWITYSWHWIRQACMRWQANHSRTVRVPVGMLGRQYKVRKTTAILMRELGRNPTEDEICAAAEITMTQLKKVREVKSGSVSLDVPIGDDTDVTRLDMLVAPEQGSIEDGVVGDISNDEARLIVEGLPVIERFVIEERYYHERTLIEIGNALELTRERVRQIERNGLNRLRRRAAQPVVRRAEKRNYLEPRKEKLQCRFCTRSSLPGLTLCKIHRDIENERVAMRKKMKERS